MRCEECVGTGKQPQNCHLPCPECGGCGLVHCCEGHVPADLLRLADDGCPHAELDPSV